MGEEKMGEEKKIFSFFYFFLAEYIKSEVEVRGKFLQSTRKLWVIPMFQHV